MGLREQKKDKTRVALLHAALRRFEAQGFAETTIDQIAEAVDVSPRTLLRYFPKKEDVVVSWVEDGMALFLATLERQPTTHTPYEALLTSARAMLEAYEAQSGFYLTIERTIAGSSAIRSRKLKLSAALAEKATAALRARYPGVDALGCELYPMVVFAILRVVVTRWVEGDGARSLLAIFEEAQAFVAVPSVHLRP